MSDITMCKGDGCKKRNACYRYTAKPDIMQSYFQGSPIEKGKCDFYINITVKMIKKW